MMGLGEHVHRLDLLDRESSGDQELDVPDHGDRVAGDIEELEI